MTARVRWRRRFSTARTCRRSSQCVLVGVRRGAGSVSIWVGASIPCVRARMWLDLSGVCGMWFDEWFSVWLRVGACATCILEGEMIENSNKIKFKCMSVDVFFLVYFCVHVCVRRGGGGAC